MTLATRRRHKLVNNDVLNTIVVKNCYSNGTVYRTDSYPNILQSTNIWEIEGVDILEFYKHKREGILLPFTNFGRYAIDGEVSEHTYFFRDTRNGNYSYLYSGRGDSSRWWNPGADDVTARFSPYFTEKYVTEAAAKIYTSGHDTLTFLAELADVREMFLKVGTNLLKLLSSLAGRKALKEISCSWLSYRYGWRTLVMDLSDLNKAIQSLSDKEKRTRYSNRSGDTFTVTDQNTWNSATTGGTIHHSWAEKAKVGLRGSVVADIDRPDFMMNPLLTGWEVIPFSFVVDWFIGIGSSLAALMFVECTGPYAAGAGIRVDGERTYSLTTTYNPPYEGYYTIEAKSQFTWQVRHPCTIPLLPRFRVNLNPLKILDLLGMILQRK